MRPVALHVEGFGIFREPVDVSFDDVDYFALVGPTGAGKSTVIDAICFALYGSVPRYDDERLVGRALSVGAQEAKVSLTFDVDSQRYCATRVVRLRDGKTPKSDALLERVTGDGPTDVIASRPKEMKDAVERVLGLPFDHFTRCVVLPQGEFARFLHDKPADRQKLLSKLLGLDRYKEIAQHARERAAAAKSEVEIHERHAASLAFATSEGASAARARRDELLSLRDELAARREQDEALAATAAAAAEAADRARTTLRELAAVVVPADVDEHASALRAAVAAEQAAADALAEAQRELASLDAAVEALPDRDVLSRARIAYARLGELEQQAVQLRDEVDAATAKVAATDLAVAEAETALATATEAVRIARDAHLAHELAAHLVAGEPCPVCEQPVAAVPQRARPAQVAAAETARTQAEKAAAAARTAAARAAAAHAAVEARAQQCIEELQAVALAVADAPDPATIDHELSRITDVAAAHQHARKHEHAARTSATAASAQVATATQAAAASRRTLHSRRDAVLRAGLEPPELEDDLANAWAALARWAQRAAAEHEAREREATARATAACEERVALVAALAARAVALGVSGAGEELADVRDAVVKAVADAQHEVQRIEDAIDAAAKAREQAAAAQAEHDVARLLAQELRSDGFERWLLVEALDTLVTSASGMLESLSGGQYSLRYVEEEFVVVDHRNADAIRSVRTLSGGETFQASLALALALSDQLASLSAGGGAKLDAIFLDEGFGTLDAETLETVAATIESLGTTGRMVGVVTHVPALAERVPVRYRVTRTDRTATIVREEL